MAVTDFGVTTAEVLGELPINTQGITTSSVPLSTTDVDRYIDAGSALYAGALRAMGKPLDGGDDADEQISEGVRAYAVHKCLERIGRSGSRAYEAARDRHTTLYNLYTSRPQLVSGDRSRTVNNVDVADRKSEALTKGRTFYEGFSW